MVRNFVAIVCGLVAGTLVVGITESTGQLVFPVFEGISLFKPREYISMGEGMSILALLTLLLAWAIGIFAGGSVTLRVANGTTWPVWAVSGIFLSSFLYVIIAVPHPIWMIPGTFAVALAAGLTAIRMFPGVKRVSD